MEQRANVKVFEIQLQARRDDTVQQMPGGGMGAIGEKGFWYSCSSLKLGDEMLLVVLSKSGGYSAFGMAVSVLRRTRPIKEVEKG